MHGPRRFSSMTPQPEYGCRAGTDAGTIVFSARISDPSLNIE
jgi:hypothetical protein